MNRDFLIGLARNILDEKYGDAKKNNRYYEIPCFELHKLVADFALHFIEIEREAKNNDETA